MPVNARVRDRHWKVWDWVSLFTRQSKSTIATLLPVATTTRGGLRVRKWVENEVNKCSELPRCSQSNPQPTPHTAAGRICWSTLIRVKYRPTDLH